MALMKLILLATTLAAIGATEETWGDSEDKAWEETPKQQHRTLAAHVAGSGSSYGSGGGSGNGSGGSGGRG